MDGHLDVLKEMTGGRGPDACIDAVGMEAHSEGAQNIHDKMKQAVRQNGDIDPSSVITHRMPLSDAARGYEIFQDKEDQCEKVILMS